MPVEILFETHSISEDNERGVATGWLPGRLSERGRNLARELGARRRDDGLVAVFTSDLARAVETAAIAFEGSQLPIRADSRLRECDYGDLNGAPVEQLAPRSRFIATPFPAGESYRQVADRVRSFVGDLVPFDGRRILVIGHSATRWALDHLLAGRALEELVDAPFDWRPGWRYRT
ncbi:MAG TPA: histidine phosphatase family protein [Candidatus Saccharimonadales bacterium]|jgi:broad specificity phosphatase PhoE|nr:histidine phosphatase family protein [Candidatus Saccharimonadales bacterium]